MKLMFRKPFQKQALPFFYRISIFSGYTKSMTSLIKKMSFCMMSLIPNRVKISQRMNNWNILIICCMHNKDWWHILCNTIFKTG